jgi:predicted nucleic acid-binding protein
VIFVDSSVLIDYFNNTNTWQVDALNDMLGNEIVIIGDYILTEVLQGFKSDKDYEKAKSVLQTFPCYEICGEMIAIKSAYNFRLLRKKGFTIRKTIDVVIATFCIEHRFTLLHNDKDFLPFEKLLGLQTVKKN